MINPEKIEKYCSDFSSKSGDILDHIERQTYLHQLSPQMISGKLQGQFLKILSQSLRPKAILEIGTFTAYSTICLAEGLEENGIFHTIEKDPELKSTILKNLKKANLHNRVELLIGTSAEIVPTLPNKYDLIFMDAKKRNYVEDYDLLFDKWALNGVLLADNTLWYGKVTEENTDITTQALKDFNRKIVKDPRVDNVLLPFRDGMNMIRKIKN